MQRLEVSSNDLRLDVFVQGNHSVQADDFIYLFIYFIKFIPCPISEGLWVAYRIINNKQ